jgi:hypothetical protein
VADVGLALSTRVEYCRGFVAPAALPHLPFADLSAWIGAACQLPPAVAGYSLGRAQDTAALQAAAAGGLPLLVLHGTEDQNITADGVVAEIGGAPGMLGFREDCVTLVVLQDIGHSVFYEYVRAPRRVWREAERAGMQGRGDNCEASARVCRACIGDGRVARGFLAVLCTEMVIKREVRATKYEQ